METLSANSRTGLVAATSIMTHATLQFILLKRHPVFLLCFGRQVRSRKEIYCNITYRILNWMRLMLLYLNFINVSKKSWQFVQQFYTESSVSFHQQHFFTFTVFCCFFFGTDFWYCIMIFFHYSLQCWHTRNNPSDAHVVVI